MPHRHSPTAAQWGAAAAPVRAVSIEQSARWLALGWHDIRRSPTVSLSYGGLFVAISLLLTFGMVQAGLGSLILPLAAGFLLVGPLAATGLYEISRRHATGEPVDLSIALTAGHRNLNQIAYMGLVLLVAMFAWIQVALIIFALFFQGSPASLGAFAGDLLQSADNIPFLLVGTAAGGILAAAVFAVSVVSLPMLLDREVGVATAIATSLAATRRNWRMMIGWAATIVVIIGAGILPLFLGLIIALPLIGHASWHAYRDLVE